MNRWRGAGLPGVVTMMTAASAKDGGGFGEVFRLLFARNQCDNQKRTRYRGHDEKAAQKEGKQEF